MPLREITRLEWPLIRHSIQQFASINSPVIITAGAAEWPAVQKWTPEFLRAALGNLTYRMRATDDEFAMMFGGNSERTSMTMGEYLAQVLSPSPSPSRAYFGNVSFDDETARPWLDQLRPDVHFPVLHTDSVGEEMRLWIGGAGQRSTIHNDRYHNLNAQIYGEKRFLIFPPEEYVHLYTREITEGCWASPVDPDAPDLDRYPDFTDALGLAATLTPGDILYIPAYWWHQAIALKFSVNVNLWTFTAGLGNWRQ